MKEQEKKLKCEFTDTLRAAVDFVNTKGLTKKELFDIRKEDSKYIVMYFD